MFDNSSRAQALKSEADVAAPLEGLGTVIRKKPCTLVAIYDFAVGGGAQGDIAMKDDAGNPAVLPSNAIIRRVLVYVATAVTSNGSATLAFKAVGAGDLLGATAKGSLTLAAKLDGVPVATAATAIGPLAADKQIYATVGTADLTAGKVYLFIDYHILPS